MSGTEALAPVEESHAHRAWCHRNFATVELLVDHECGREGDS